MLGNPREADWSQRYRPLTLADCVLPARIKRPLAAMVQSRFIENLVFHGSYGIGKTSAALALCADAGADYMTINGSLDNSIDGLRANVERFARTCSMKRSRKVVLIDEAEGLSREYQSGLRAFMEEVSANCSFIFTTNHFEKISSAIKSRALAFDFSCTTDEAQAMKMEFAARLNRILIAERATCNAGRVAETVETVFPDYRQILKRVRMIAT